MGNQGNCSRDRSRCLFASEGLSEQSPVPGSMGECPLLDTQGNAGSAGRSPAGGKAGRTATCKHALGAKRHQAWSSKDLFIFPSGKSKMSNAAHRLPGRVSPPSLSSCPLGCPGWGWNLKGLSTKSLKPSQRSKLRLQVSQPRGGNSFLPCGCEFLQEAPPLQEGRRLSLSCQGSADLHLLRIHLRGGFLA